MNATLNLAATSMPALPEPLAAAFRAALAAGPKRERTQAQLVHAAVQVLAADGVAGASIQRIAQAAGMTTGTVYNHFGSKDELVGRVAAVLADSLCRAINDSYADVADGAQRMAIGQRRYVWLAAEAPAWALLLLDVMAAAPEVTTLVNEYPLADLRLGVRQKRFRVPSEAAALDVIVGVCTQAMRRVAFGQAPARHDIASAGLVLRALGLPPEEADEVAQRPLPPLPAPAQA